MSLISQGLGAVWSVIYLTENMSEDGQAKLTPFAIYPQKESESSPKLPPLDLAEIWRSPQSSFITRLLPHNLSARFQIEDSEHRQLEPAETKQLILPLIHQDVLIGLLVTGRDDRQWQAAEVRQIEEIARSISLARFIEFQYHWTQDELALQENLRRIEHDRLDNLLHQLRNPLTALRTFSKLLLKRLVPEDPNAKIAQSILSQSDRFQALLEQFEAEARALSHIEAAEEELPLLTTKSTNVDRSSFLLPGSATELEPVDLQDIITPLLDTAAAIALEREIELVNRLPAHIPAVRGDLAALRE
ncbi:MAG: histidine kinase dimerization/phospho-acceptor domain-containing protein, partial [Cyanobacteria bacterium J06623_1]